MQHKCKRCDLSEKDEGRKERIDTRSREKVQPTSERDSYHLYLKATLDNVACCQPHEGEIFEFESPELQKRLRTSESTGAQLGKWDALRSALWTLLIITFWRVWWLIETTEYHKVRWPWPADTWLMSLRDSLRGWRRGVDSWRMMMWRRWSDVTTPCSSVILKQPPRYRVRFKTDEKQIWQVPDRRGATC